MCAIEVYEVYKVIRRDISEERAIEAVSALRRATIAPVDEPLALEAADLSLAHGLAMADSLVYATARRFGATLVTGGAMPPDGLPLGYFVRPPGATERFEQALGEEVVLFQNPPDARARHDKLVVGPFPVEVPVYER